jgi:hypothetical protein
MYAKGIIFGIALIMMSFLPALSHGQTRLATTSVEDIDASAFANGSIIIISAEETDTPGYFHTKYAYVDRLCGVQLVDRYGAPVDPRDKELMLVEQRMCTEFGFDTRDGE